MGQHKHDQPLFVTVVLVDAEWPQKRVGCTALQEVRPPFPMASPLHGSLTPINLTLRLPLTLALEPQSLA